MENYDVVTNDDHKVGHLAGSEGNYLIVEHGLLRKTKHAVPRDMAEVDEQAQVVRLSISKRVLEEGPTVDGDELDNETLARYYGLSEETAAPDTQGYGDVVGADPARTAEQDARQFGDESPDEQRARIRESEGPDAGFDTGPHRGSVGIHQDRYEVKE